MGGGGWCGAELLARDGGPGAAAAVTAYAGNNWQDSFEIEAVAFGFADVLGVAGVVELEPHFVGRRLLPESETHGEVLRRRGPQADFVSVVFRSIERLGAVGPGAGADLKRAPVARVKLRGLVRLH